MLLSDARLFSIQSESDMQFSISLPLSVWARRRYTFSG